MPDLQRLGERVRRRVPPVWREVARGAREHDVLVLGAALAFFGLISFAPALAVGFGILQLVVSPEASEAIVELLQDTVTTQFGLVDLLEEMEDRGGRYAGIGFLTLLWPATTLASGWARALNEIFETGSPGPSGLKGRLRGFIPGAILVGALLALFVTVSFGTALAGAEGPLLAVVVVGGGVAVQVLLNVVVYRYLPSERFAWGVLVRGAGFATVGVVLGTAGFAAVLALTQDFGEQYPEQLTTAIVLGLWLYVTNTALLMGAEVSAALHRRSDG